MKAHIRARLIEITEWRRDQQRIDGDVAHEGESSVLHVLAGQVKERLEDCTFKPEHLPFEYEFDLEPECEEWITEDEVKDRLLDEYITEFMEHDYVIPVDCELEWEILKEQE